MSKKRELGLSLSLSVVIGLPQCHHITSNIFYLFMRLPRSFKLTLYFSFPVLRRCSSQYTSVTMTSILLRYPLHLRHCAGMWWSCARNLVRQIATCLRCGGGQVRYSVPWLILHSGGNCLFLYMEISCVVNRLIFEEAYLFGSATEMQQSP